MAEWQPVIGLEIHVQLSTRTKMFCGCAVGFGEAPNTRTCPTCLGVSDYWEEDQAFVCRRCGARTDAAKDVRFMSDAPKAPSKAPTG